MWPWRPLTPGQMLWHCRYTMMRETWSAGILKSRQLTLDVQWTILDVWWILNLDEDYIYFITFQQVSTYFNMKSWHFSGLSFNSEFQHRCFPWFDCSRFSPPLTPEVSIRSWTAARSGKSQWSSSKWPTVVATRWIRHSLIHHQGENVGETARDLWNHHLDIVVSSIFYFHPYLGKWLIQFDWYFSDGLKPPTSIDSFK